MNLGANVDAEGVRYRLWAPKAHEVEVVVESVDGTERRIAMAATGEGYFTACDPAGKAGDAYGYSLGGPVFPDPASRAQEGEVHGRSLVVDPQEYGWNDQNWRRPSFRDLVIYEMHIGTFTEAGTFRGAIDRLAFLKESGMTAIEIMPVADWPGERNWGYDGVLIYAPARAYGSPDDLRALVDAAHAVGLAVLLDVVYNHFGPDGNYLAAYSSEYFSRQHPTPWGDGFNFDGPSSGPVREFFLSNPGYWMDEFHMDGFRFDATHEIQDESPSHILAEMTASVHKRGGYAIAEDGRNDVVLMEREVGLGFDAVWADDFHHTARVSQTGENHSYFQDFVGTLAEVAECLDHGWLYRGQKTPSQGQPRGTEAKPLPPEAFVHCLSNHDQTGNRALGDRVGTALDPAAYRALSVLLCLTPYTPMFFMGQEWGATSPFLFFCDHNEKLGSAITAGRRREFASFPGFSDPAMRESIPDPQAEETFLSSKLNWAELETPGAAGLRELHRVFLGLRNSDARFRPQDRDSWRAGVDSGRGVVQFGPDAEHYLLIFRLSEGDGGVRSEDGYKVVLSSEERRFGGSGQSAWSAEGERWSFATAEAVLLKFGGR